jgi:hypothetical protein
MISVKWMSLGHGMLQVQVFSGFLLLKYHYMRDLPSLNAQYRNTLIVFNVISVGTFHDAGQWSCGIVMPCRCCVVFHCMVRY